VDDNSTFVDSVKQALSMEGFDVEGCSTPADLRAWCKRPDFDFELILLDMHLGVSESGEILNAPKMLIPLRTFVPHCRVLIFSQADIDPKENYRCSQLGALAVIPKALDITDLVWLVREFARTGETDPVAAQQRVIEVLWSSLSTSDKTSKGPYLEMLTVNLFNATQGFRVIGQNMLTNAGEIDVLIQNENVDLFWQALKSLQLIVECKNWGKAVDVNVVNDLADLVETRGAEFSRAGILVTMSKVTSTFRVRRQELIKTRAVYVFVVNAKDIEKLVHLSAAAREEYLRSTFSGQ